MRVFSDWDHSLGKCKIIIVKLGDWYINKRLARVFVGLRCEGIPNIPWKGVGESFLVPRGTQSIYLGNQRFPFPSRPTVATPACCEVHATNPDMGRTYLNTKYVDLGLRLGNAQTTVDLRFLF
jgi:hypothetical protein